MSEDERGAFARWLQRHELRLGNAKAAYSAAGVNPNTWKRAKRGESVKPYIVTKIVKALAPDTGGDWRALNLTVGASTQDASPGYVSAPGERVEGDSEEKVLGAIEQMRRDMLAMEERLSDKIELESRERGDERAALSERLDRLEGGA